MAKIATGEPCLCVHTCTDQSMYLHFHGPQKTDAAGPMITPFQCMRRAPLCCLTGRAFLTRNCSAFSFISGLKMARAVLGPGDESVSKVGADRCGK
jgi:hypothetical protein